jgi:microcystin-dependent protein
MLVSFDFAPKGWAECNGQLLAISQNQALFALLGTTYGGDGRTTFALPDLRGRVPVHASSVITLGELGGEESHTLILGELPRHAHAVRASSSPGDSLSPVSCFPARETGGGDNYGPVADGFASPGAVRISGGGQPHENRMPFITLRYIIATVGIFPSRN